LRFARIRKRIDGNLSRRQHNLLTGETREPRASAGTAVIGALSIVKAQMNDTNGTTAAKIQQHVLSVTA
jgi:hypothetical protein